MKISKIIYHVLIFGLLLLLLYKIEWIWYPSYQVPSVQTEERCVEYIKEGKLYGGDPYCFQGPFVYSILLLFDNILVSTETGKTIFYILSLFIIGYIIAEIKEKETGNPSSTFVYLLTILLFGKWFIDFATIPATFFLLLGFYILCYTEFTWKNAAAGIMFSFAMLSKPHNTPLVVVPIILFYFFNKYNIWNKEKEISIKHIIAFIKECHWQIIGVLAPIIILFIATIILLKGFLLAKIIIIDMIYSSIRIHISILKRMIFRIIMNHQESNGVMIRTWLLQEIL